MHRLDPPASRIAVISAHTSPLGRLGGHKAGGMNVYVRETARELARLGHAVDIFTRDDGTQPEPVVSLAPGVRVVHLGAGPRGPLEKDGLWEYMPAFLHSLRAFREREGLRYDLVHSHYWLSGWAGSYLRRLWDVPHVTMFHTLGEVKNRARSAEREPPYRIETERRVAATADAIVVASEHERDMLERLYGADPARIVAVPCGVNLDYFRPFDRHACRAALGLGDAPVVLFVGRLEPLKGLDLLIDAFARLEHRDAMLLIVGGDEHAAGYRRALRRQAREAGVLDRVRFVEATPQERLPLFYNAADVCVAPSFYESFGLVPIEAMACGTPVVASRVGGLTGTVRHGENGFLIPWRRAEAFAARIDQILGDAELRARMSRAALATATRFRWPAVATELDTLYARLWEARAAAGCHAAGEPVAAVAEHALCHTGG
jgi:D-inositol-3-phosphate glycosyltransferase